MMARKLFNFDNPGYLDTNMEEECGSEKTFVRTPVPSPRFQNKRSRSLSESESAYQDLVNYKLMYQSLKKQHKNQAQRELPSVPSSTPRTRRRSEPVVMLTHSRGELGCCRSRHAIDSSIPDSTSAKSNTKYLEPIDSTKSFRDRINSSLEENSEVFADVESEQSTRKKSVCEDAQSPHYFVLEPPIKEETAETQAKSSCESNSKKIKKKKKASKKHKKRGDNACGLHVENNNRRTTDKLSTETSTPDTIDNPYYHVLEIVNQSEKPQNQTTRSFGHRILDRLSAKVRTDTRNSYDFSTAKPVSPTRTKASCFSPLMFLVSCILIFSVVTCVMTILVIRGQIESLCICSNSKGLFKFLVNY